MAGRIVRRLERLGIDVWFDTSSIPIGSLFARAIEGGITDSAATLFLISEASLASAWCRREVDWTIDAGKVLVPVLVQTVDTGSNWLQARQRIELLGGPEGEAFDLGIYQIVRNLHESAPGVVTDDALATAARQVGWAHIDAKIEDLRATAVKAEDYLNGIEVPPDGARAAFEARPHGAEGEKLAAFALGGVRDTQVAAHAAQIIARSGNLDALHRIGEATQMPATRTRAFDALGEILQHRRGALPRVVLLAQYPGFLWQAGRRTLQGGMTRSTFWSCILMAVLALCFVSFLSFGPDMTVRPLARLGHTASGALYGAILGLGIALTSIILPRLYALGLSRFAVGAALGAGCTLGAFVLYNALVYYRMPGETLAALVPLSVLLILGFAIAGVLQPGRSLSHAAVTFGLGLAGAGVAFAVSCDWSPVYPRLLAFAPDSCTSMSAITAAMLALGPVLPALGLAVAQAGAWRLSPTLPKEVSP